MSAIVVSRYPRSVIDSARPSSSRRRNGCPAPSAPTGAAGAATSTVITRLLPALADRSCPSTVLPGTVLHDTAVLRGTTFAFGVIDEQLVQPVGRRGRCEASPGRAPAEGDPGRRLHKGPGPDAAGGRPPLRAGVHDQHPGLRPYGRGGRPSACQAGVHREHRRFEQNPADPKPDDG